MCFGHPTSPSTWQLELLFHTIVQEKKNRSFNPRKLNMESLGTMSEGAWNSYNGMCYEEADFMAHLVGNCSLTNDVLSSSHYQVTSCWPNQESNLNVVGFYDSSIYSSDEIDISFPEGSSHGGGSEIPFPESYHPTMSQQFLVANKGLPTMDYSSNALEGGHFLNHDVNNDSNDRNGNSTELPMPERMEEDKVTSLSSKKRLRIPRDVQRSKRSMKVNESIKVDNDNDGNNSDYKKVVPHKYNSSSCSEDDNELNGVVSGSSPALNSNGKTRANRGLATDAQSLYARKRRERINERLRILQRIVPNGTKVDISTMLEEAVEYVKFLQLQIKLLSSDEHWMYAPIAYNGMDIGLDLRIPTPNFQT